MSCIAATTGSFRPVRLATWPTGFPAPATSSCPGPTTCRPSATGEALLDEIEEFLVGSRGAHEADRGLATILFTDIVGSTEARPSSGTAAGASCSSATTPTVRRELAVHRGREVKTMGDGFLATFDGPARAIRCALRDPQAS